MDDSWREGMDNSDRWDKNADGGEWEPSCPSFLEQLLSGSFPIRMPMAMEIYAEGVEIEVHRLDPGQKRRRADSHVMILDTVDEPQSREQIGWLAAAAIRDRVQELG